MMVFLWVSLALNATAVGCCALGMGLTGKASGVNLATFFVQGALGVWALFLILGHHQ